MAKVQTSDRVSNFTESVIREMTRIAIDSGAVNLAQGYPDFAAPEVVKEAAVRAIRADVNQYSITWGTLSLRTAITESYRRRYSLDINPQTDVAVCCGATECMIAALLATTNPGDEVIIFEPFYENYRPDAWMCGAIPRLVPLHPPAFGQDGMEMGRWHFDPDDLAAAFGPKTRAIIITSPHNPTGHVFTCDELEIIAALCIKHDVLAITDEIYEHITYDGRDHIPMVTLPGMAERTITISGLSKTFSITGWRLGYCFAPTPIATAIRKVHDFMTVNAPTPLQEAGAIALTLGEEYYVGLRAEYSRKRSILLTALQQKGFIPSTPEGAYYIMANYSELSKEDDTSFAMRMVREAGVAAVPGSSFYWHKTLSHNMVRFCYCKMDETLHNAAERLGKWCV
jgi:aspartate/methionine/tyrosine aminotransferase